VPPALTGGHQLRYFFYRSLLGTVLFEVMFCGFFLMMHSMQAVTMCNVGKLVPVRLREVHVIVRRGLLDIRERQRPDPQADLTLLRGK
jgi:hypothetical protein